MNPSFPTEILDDRVAIVGISGYGKTVTAKLGVEKLLKAKARVCIVDPTGAWWGLRSSADGKGAGFPITIFGGEHGDIPINPRAGRILGETVAEGDFSCIIDLTSLKTMKDRRAFMKDFAEALHEKNRNPLHLILDEADLWAPQKPLEDIAALLGARIDEIVRRGRLRGFCPWLITQRPAVIHKDVLSQLDTLISMKLTSSQDRDALGAWIEGNADKAEEKRIRAALPAFQKGQGLIWAPGHGMLVERQFGMPTTFDSSRTPKRGERIKAPKERAEVDLDKLRAAMAEVEQEAAENDPRALKAEVAKLKAALNAERQRKPAIVTNPEELDAAHALGKLEGEAEMRARAKAIFASLEELIRGCVSEAMDGPFNSHLAELMSGEGRDIGARAAFERAKKKVDVLAKEIPLHAHDRKAALDAAAYRHAAKPSVVNGEGVTLTKAERKIMIALAQYHPQGRTKRQLATLSGYAGNGGGFKNALSSNRSAGRLTSQGDTYTATEKGLADLGSFDPLPTGDALLQHWYGQLSKAEREVLTVLASAYPDTLTREQIAAKTETQYEPSGGGFKNALSRLRVLELINRGEPIRASDDLFG